MFQVLVIDPYAREVRRQWVTGKLEDYYDAIGKGCHIVQPVYPEGLAEGDLIYADEEGLFSGEQTAAFNVPGYPMIMGRGVVLGTSPTGSSTAHATPIEKVEALVTWLDAARINRMLETLG